jgi:hypothetical protein
MNYKPTWNLGTIPDGLLLSEAGRRRVAMRTTAGCFRKGAGRKPVMVPCPRCGKE